MNVLIVSLLRAGDLLMHIKSVEDFAKSTTTNIYLLTHRQNKGLEFLFPWIKRIFYFDRELVQKSQKEDFLALDSGFQHTMKLISELNEVQFHTIYNFTNTKVSALFISLINGNSKIGLNNNSLKYYINDPNGWIQYLNNTENSKFHMIDIFRNSIIENKTKNVKTTNDTQIKKERSICIQTLTSDQKKNWPLKNWNNLIKQLKVKLHEYKIYILCSNSEKTKLFDSLNDNIANIFVSTYKEAYDLINSSSLLITGDTSIKHLASFTETPVLEIALGSARPSETGIYSEKGYLLFNPISCQPCKHSFSCSFHFGCQKTISVQDVLDSATFILKESNFFPQGLLKACINQNSLVNYQFITDLKNTNSNLTETLV
jgi:ADP-heptose:LPS heptosyltransferase